MYAHADRILPPSSPLINPRLFPVRLSSLFTSFDVSHLGGGIGAMATIYINRFSPTTGSNSARAVGGRPPRDVASRRRPFVPRPCLPLATRLDVAWAARWMS